MSSYREGERVHFRSLEHILAMLETGYLELEYVLEGTTRYQIVRKIGDMYRFSVSDASELPRHPVDEPQLIDLVESCALDLHAFRWYPTLSSSHMGAYLSQMTSHMLHERINVLLDVPFASLLLAEEAEEGSICNQ